MTAQQHDPHRPASAALACAFMNVDVDGSTDSYRRAGRRIPFARLDSAPG